MNVSCWLASIAGGFGFGIFLHNSVAFAQDQTAPKDLDLGPTQMIKIVIPQPYSSNRAEYDYVLPLSQSSTKRVFWDSKIFAEQRPFLGATPGTDKLQAFGQSARLGLRELVSQGNAYWGVSVGYDSLWQQESYFQQAGLALEYSRPSYQFVLTAGVPFAASNTTESGNNPLSSVNFQVSLPTGIERLAVQPRIYLVGSESTGTTAGGQLQFTYGFYQGFSTTLASNYDAFGGASGSLTFQVVFPQRSAEKVGSTINPVLINSYAGPVGNNGSRVIRLNGIPLSSGN